MFKVSILKEAEIDIDDAFIWYEMNVAGLGFEFYETVNSSVLHVAENPFASEEIYKDIRRFVISKFPYGIYYKAVAKTKELQIIGVIHFKRSLKVLKKRI